MKKMILSTVLALNISVATAATIEFVHYRPAGGGNDLHSSALIADLQRQGIKTEKVFLKSCASAMERVKNNPNSVLMSFTGDVTVNDNSLCPGLASNKELQLFSQIGSMPIMLCTTPQNNKLTLADLSKQNRPWTVAAPVTPLNKSLDIFFKKMNPPISWTHVPYRGGGEIRAAVLANNTELFWTATGLEQFIEAGSRCLASSTPNNKFKVPTFSQLLADKSYPEWAMTSYMWYSGNLDPKISTGLINAMRSEDFAQRLKNLGASHSGLGANVDATKQYEDFLKFDKFISEIK